MKQNNVIHISIFIPQTMPLLQLLHTVGLAVWGFSITLFRHVFSVDTCRMSRSQSGIVSPGSVMTKLELKHNLIVLITLAT